MKTIVAGDCREDNIFHAVDPTGFRESEFEAEVLKALSCLLPNYWCGVFAGKFVLEGDARVADLALLHKSFSHWFVVEVELAGHSLEHHILPQVRCFRYGDASSTCLSSLLRAFPHLSTGRVEMVMQFVPRYVALIANLPNPDWTKVLKGLDVQHLTLSVYRTALGKTAYELQGNLTPRLENLGFGRYSATDNCIRIPKGCGLAVGSLEVIDQFGITGIWTVREANKSLWISKDRGPALIGHGTYVQFLKTLEGKILIRPSA